MPSKRPSGSPAVRNPPASKAERDERVTAALRDVDSNGIPVKQAARDHDVAYTTLLARRKGRRSRLEYQADITKLGKGADRTVNLNAQPVPRTPSPPMRDSVMPGTPLSRTDHEAYVDLITTHGGTLTERQWSIARRRMRKAFDYWYTEALLGWEFQRQLEAKAAAREQRQKTRRRLDVPDGPLSIENLQAARQSQLSSHDRISSRRSGRSCKARGNGTALPVADVENRPLSAPLDGEVDYSMRSPSFDSFKSLSDAEDLGVDSRAVDSAI